METPRTISQVLPAPMMHMGKLHVRQPLPSNRLPYLDPFVLLHHAHTIADPDQQLQKAGVDPHPHRGFSPVTFVFKGGVRHRDSRQNDGTVYEGGTQWMNAGMGIIHSERPLTAEQEIIQMWVNTPAANKMDQPSYYPLTKEQTPATTSPDGKVVVNVVTGDLLGQQGPIPTFTPINSGTIHMQAGGTIDIPVPASHNLFVYFLDGYAKINDDRLVTGKNMVTFSHDGDYITLEALEDTRALLMSGEPIGEEIVAQGPFVMNSDIQIMEAYRDFRKGKMGILIED
ncbi:pirin family protein [Arsenicibacter rosenii]|uniref:Nuclease PIN n=1 Tax=Arsenicibacter rosenii TaxID=1750698 RepID=A0A1S2VCB4_9BACT|nr:pirin-like C-terminal cupin domain-containing protein [Arsenicibacter rosenii]OIN56353.1 nuclease PIN [Arsenicibacter rosenii]